MPVQFPPAGVAGAAFRAANQKPVQGAELQIKLRSLAENLQLGGNLGEGDGSPLKAYFRSGPVKELTTDNTLKVLGFNVVKAKTYDFFQFTAFDKKDAGFWRNFTAAAFDPQAAAEVRKLLTGPNVKKLATIVADDHINNSGANGYLVAWMKDGSIAVLRGTVGGQGM